jgi:hypothetical protein
MAVKTQNCFANFSRSRSLSGSQADFPVVMSSMSGLATYHEEVVASELAKITGAEIGNSKIHT